MGLRWKMILSLMGLCIGGGYWAYNWLIENIRPQFLRIMEDGMAEYSYAMARMVEGGLPDTTRPEDLQNVPILRILEALSQETIQAKIYEWEKKKVELRVYITDTKGLVRLDTDQGRDLGKDYSRWNDVIRALRGQYGARSSSEKNRAGRLIDSLYVAWPLRKKGRVVGSITICKSKASLIGWARRAQTSLFWGLVLGVCVIFLCGLLLAQALLHPIFRLTEYARDIAAGRRVPSPHAGKDELGELTRAFVEMKEALLQRQDIERFVTQLTHELKSPISAIQGAAELLEDPEMPRQSRVHFLLNIQNQTQRMNNIVQRLLALVALEQREVIEKPQKIPVCALLEDVVERFLPLAEQKKIHLQIREVSTPSRPSGSSKAFGSAALSVPSESSGVLDSAATKALSAPSDPSGDSASFARCGTSFGDLSLWGDRFLLEQALTNLLQNSIDFTPREGEIEILVCTPHPSSIEFQILDSGAGIPEYALPRVLERFYSLERPDTGAKGTGLGLPFVKQVALLHGGDFSISNRPTRGAIARFRVLLFQPLFLEALPPNPRKGTPFP